MFGLRGWELLIIGFVVVLLFGANKLPQLGAGLGNGIRSFKKAISGGGDEDDKDKPQPPPPPADQPPKA